MIIANILRVSPDTSIPYLRAQINEVQDQEEILKKINEPDEFGDTPLHIAAAAGKFLTVKFLVSSGANINAKNQAGSTPLHKAMLSGINGKPIVEFLLENKAEWTSNNSGFTPFTYAKDILRDQKQFFFALLEKETKKPAKITIKVSTNALPIIIGKGGKMLENIRVEAQTDVEVPERRNRNQNESEHVEIHLTARNEKELEQGKKKIEKLVEKQEQEKKKDEEKKKDDEKKKEEVVVKNNDVPQGKEAPKAKKEPEDYNIKKKEAGKKKGPGTEEPPVGKIVSDIALNQASAQTQQKERNVRIPKDKHGIIIGKKGENIERIKNTYGVTVFIPDRNEQSDIITIKGNNKEALEDAKYDILQLLRDGRSGTGGRGRGGRGAGGGRGPGGPGGPGGSGGNRRYGRDDDQDEKKAPAKPKVPQKINLNDAKDWPAFG